jgi:hypothetical protein
VPRFYAHFNRALGKYYRSERDMTKDMKAKGLEFIPKGQSMENEPKRKSYSLSSDTRAIVSEIAKSKDKKGNFKPSGRLLDIIAQRHSTLAQPR